MCRCINFQFWKLLGGLSTERNKKCIAKEEKLFLAEEELVTSRNQASSSYQMVQELKKAKDSLEADLANRETIIKDKEKVLLQQEKEK
eukprot:g35141.t1